MRLKFKEDPKEWRKSTLLTLGALALVSALLRWRHVLNNQNWVIALAVLAFLAVAAWVQPRWFRGFYRLSLRAGFFTSQVAGRIVLAVFFLLVLTPFGWLLRLSGKDLLQIKRRPDAKTYWNEASDSTPLDKLY